MRRLRMARRWSVPLLSASVALLAIAIMATGLTPVSGAIPNAGVYSACLTKSTGKVEVINHPKVKCGKGERLIRWSQQGPAGPQGGQGPQGPQGPAGPADWNAIPNKPAGFADGADAEGVTAVKIISVTTTPVAIAPGGVFGTVSADCPAGFLAVGGGHQQSKPPIDLTRTFIVESRASDADTWRVEAYNTDPTTQALIRAQVTCLRAEPGGLTLAAKNSKYGPKRSKGRTSR
jgi:hypothetical protein